MNSPPLSIAIHAGAPNPANDTDEIFDLASHLISDPAHTFYVRVEGDSMVESRISDGDILVVDRALGPKPSDVVVVRVGDNYTVKKFKSKDVKLRLVQPHENNEGLEISDETLVCGVARFAIHRL